MVNVDIKNKQIYKINRKFLILIELFQKQTNQLKCKKKQIWTLIQTSNEKRNPKKTGAGW